MVENRMLKQIDEKFFNMGLQIAKNNKTYEDNKEIRLNDVQNQLSYLRENLELEVKKRWAFSEENIKKSNI